MKSNKATWIFLLVLVVCFIWKFHAFESTFHKFNVTFIFLYMFALYLAISFFDWINKPNKNFIEVRICNHLTWFKSGGEVSFWHRQFIFFGGLAVGLLLMKFA